MNNFEFFSAPLISAVPLLPPAVWVIALLLAGLVAALLREGQRGTGPLLAEGGLLERWCPVTPGQLHWLPSGQIVAAPGADEHGRSTRSPDCKEATA